MKLRKERDELQQDKFGSLALLTKLLAIDDYAAAIRMLRDLDEAADARADASDAAACRSCVRSFSSSPSPTTARRCWS